MHAKDEYISILGHELRTPLTSIRGYLSMVLEGDMGEINDDVRKSLNHCYDSSVRIIRLINDMLALSKIENGKMEYFNGNIKIPKFLTSLYDEVILDIENKGLTLDIQVDKNLKESYLYLDEDRLKQVFINLINNSVKFTDRGGKIQIIAKNIGSKVKFSITDNGIGIPEKKQKIIFDKFSQVDCDLQRENTCGLGIGLALCKNIIHDFGSIIEVDSEVGVGSNFSFLLDIKK